MCRCWRCQPCVLLLSLPQVPWCVFKGGLYRSCKHTTVLFTLWALVRTKKLKSADMTVPPDFFFLTQQCFNLNIVVFPLTSPWRCKQRSIFSAGADSLRCGVSVNQVCWSNCRLQKADHKILLAITLKTIELEQRTTQQVCKFRSFFMPQNLDDR